MTALWFGAGDPAFEVPDRRGGLRLVQADEAWEDEAWDRRGLGRRGLGRRGSSCRAGGGERGRGARPSRSGVGGPSSPSSGVLLVALALPLSGTGGRSHATGSAPVETSAGGVYTVKAGDTLWSIAQRLDPSADPRPMVAQLARTTGSDTVFPGEQDHPSLSTWAAAGGRSETSFGDAMTGTVGR